MKHVVAFNIYALNEDSNTYVEDEPIPNKSYKIYRTTPTAGNGTALIIFGGHPNEKFGPKYLLSKMPESIKKNKAILYVRGNSSSPGVEEAKKHVPKGYTLDSMIGFSAGGNRVWPHWNSGLKFIGLIDPSTPEEYQNTILPDHVKMWAWPPNWGKGSALGNRLKKVIEANKKNNRNDIEIKKEHFQQVVPDFLDKFASNINITWKNTANMIR